MDLKETLGCVSRIGAWSGPSETSGRPRCGDAKELAKAAPSLSGSARISSVSARHKG